MVCITRYARWYTDPDRDAYPQGYGELFAPFDAHNASVGPAELLTEVSTSEDTFLAFMQLDAEGVIRIYHRLRRMDTILGGSPRCLLRQDDRYRGGCQPYGCHRPCGIGGDYRYPGAAAPRWAG
jgi:hypothetical protein